MVLLRVALFLAGLAIVLSTLFSAVQTFVLPRRVNDSLTRVVFRLVRKFLGLWVDHTHTYESVDRVMAYYAPISLLLLPAVWLVCVALGYTLMFRAVGAASWRLAFTSSGSSLLTLGFAPITSTPAAELAFSEAAIGLILVALLISYLPTIYAAFSRREATVNMLSVRAGDPPSAEQMMLRYNRIHGLNQLHDVWLAWEAWFVDIHETHTSLAALAFFRSPQPHHSWVTAAGAVLDAASIANAVLDVPHDPQADLCIRAGFLALRDIADIFRIQHNPAPRPTDPISILRGEFDEVCDHLAEAGVALKPDREQAWRDYAGWRVNYDTVLLALARLTLAPYAPWSSDRSLLTQRPTK